MKSASTIFPSTEGNLDLSREVFPSEVLLPQLTCSFEGPKTRPRDPIPSREER